MMKQAQQNFPSLETQDALQAQADLGPGREAAKGEGCMNLRHHLPCLNSKLPSFSLM